jgi:hypothetical protein
MKEIIFLITPTFLLLELKWKGTGRKKGMKEFAGEDIIDGRPLFRIETQKRKENICCH